MYLFWTFLSYDSFKTYTTAAAAVTQFSSTNLLSLLGNVDVRSLSAASSGALTEAGGEEDDEQNCPQSSRSKLKYFKDFPIFGLLIYHYSQVLPIKSYKWETSEGQGLGGGGGGTCNAVHVASYLVILNNYSLKWR